MRVITSDAITWNAPNDEHPARSASQRSYSAVAKGDLDEWLTVYAEDAVIEDPVGPSMFDPEGKGHHGHDGIAAFWHQAIAPIARSSGGRVTTQWNSSPAFHSASRERRRSVTDSSDGLMGQSA